MRNVDRPLKAGLPFIEDVCERNQITAFPLQAKIPIVIIEGRLAA